MFTPAPFILSAASPGDFPRVASEVKGSTSGTSMDLPLPSGIVAGDVILVILGYVSSEDEQFPAGWTVHDHGSRLMLVSRLADGTEGGTVTVTASTSRQRTYAIFRITGAHGDVVGEIVGGDDLPIVTPAWGSAPTLWFATISGRRPGNWDITAPPAGYTNLDETASSSSSTGSSHTKMGWARRELEAGSEDPGPFGITGTPDFPASATVAVRPA